jgi:hypothetical protein
MLFIHFSFRFYYFIKFINENLISRSIVGDYHIVSIPGWQFFPRAFENNPLCSWGGQIKTGLGFELPKEGQYVVCCHESMANAH